MAVKVAPDASNFRISDGLSDPHKGDLVYDTKLNVWHTGCEIIPPGNWTPLGIDTELTEEQYAELLGATEYTKDLGYFLPVYGYWGFKHYKTYKEAFASLMQANGCYSVNPVMPPDDLHSYDQDKSWVKEFEEAEANTGTWLILKRLS